MKSNIIYQQHQALFLTLSETHRNPWSSWYPAMRTSPLAIKFLSGWVLANRLAGNTRSTAFRSSSHPVIQPIPKFLAGVHTGVIHNHQRIPLIWTVFGVLHFFRKIIKYLDNRVTSHGANDRVIERSLLRFMKPRMFTRRLLTEGSRSCSPFCCQT